MNIKSFFAMAVLVLVSASCGKGTPLIGKWEAWESQGTTTAEFTETSMKLDGEVSPITGMEKRKVQSSGKVFDVIDVTIIHDTSKTFTFPVVLVDGDTIMMHSAVFHRIKY